MQLNLTDMKTFWGVTDLDDANIDEPVKVFRLKRKGI